MTPAAGTPGPPGGQGQARRAIIVLGCAAVVDENGRLAPSALLRRVRTAALAFAEASAGDVGFVVASGGRRWGRAVEADAMAAELEQLGVPSRAIVRERASLSTRDNARFAAAALARRGLRSALLVTCDWHMPRARILFARAGVEVTPIAAVSPPPSVSQRAWRRVREGWLAWFLVLAACTSALGACTSAPSRGGLGASDGGLLPPGPVASVLDRIEKAQDTRRALDLPADAAASRDPRERRAYARALAEIGGEDAAPLLRALVDEDAETVAWAAYGLGQGCAGGGPARVAALAARLASIETAPGALAFAESPAGAPGAILWALGHCGGDTAARTIAAWLQGFHGPPPIAEAAAYALGEAAARRGALSLDEATLLLGAATGSPPLDAAFYAFSHVDQPLPPGLSERLAAASHEALSRPGELRTLAVRARALTGDDEAATDLLRVLTSDAALAPERIEAARALGRLGKPGQAALAEAAATLPRAADALLAGPSSVAFPPALAILRALAGVVPPRAEPALWAIAHLDAGPASPIAVRRRASLLRCAAALALARGSWESEVLAQCDVGDGEAGERARLDALDRRVLGPAGRAAWSSLAASPHLRIREAALELASRHGELGDVARAAMAVALEAPEAGVVAAAAYALRAHPESDGAVVQALRTALGRAWPPDTVQTRLALLDVAAAEAAASALPEAVAYAEAACRDANGTLRARAARALAALRRNEGMDAGPPCPAPAGVVPAPEIGHELSRPVRLTLDTDAGELVVRLDPHFAPIAVTRLVALARAGFYDGTVVHRVSPGFVVQFGDRGGDGYGGAGRLLRCETAPASFHRFDVGVALAGRDTGSSQIFVTLARSPHLDGEYAWIGTAESGGATAGAGWDGVVEGDVIRGVHVDP